jgi:ankyrin repeat protein
MDLLLTRSDLELNVSRAPPIYLAAERGHLEVVRRLVSLQQVDINQTFWRKSPLFIAIENGYRGIAKLLLKQGSRLKRQDFPWRYRTPPCCLLWKFANCGAIAQRR